MNGISKSQQRRCAVQGPAKVSEVTMRFEIEEKSPGNWSVDMISSWSNNAHPTETWTKDGFKSHDEAEEYAHTIGRTMQLKLGNAEGSA